MHQSELSKKVEKACIYINGGTDFNLNGSLDKKKRYYEAKEKGMIPKGTEYMIWDKILDLNGKNRIRGGA